MLPVLLWLDVTPLPAAFWPSLDALCAQTTQLASIPSESVEGRESSQASLIAYCKDGTPPRFAARPYAERSATLATLYAALNTPLPPTSPAEPEKANTARHEPVASAAHASVELSLGFAGQRVLGAVVGEVCRMPEAARVLRSVCQSAKSSMTLSELRHGVMADLANAIVTAVRSTDAGDALSAGTVFAWALEHPRLDVAMEALASQAPGCASSSDVATPCTSHALSPRRIGRVATRLLGDGAKLDRPTVHYENVVEELLRDEAETPALRLRPEARAATRELVDAMKLALAEPSPLTSGAAIAARRSTLVVLGKAASLAALASRSDGHESADAARASVALASLLQAIEESSRWLTLAESGDARALFDAVAPTLEKASSKSEFGASAIGALRVASTLASAKDADELQRAARDALVPIPAWVDRVVLDVNLSPPSFTQLRGESNLSLNGDMTVGYNGDAVGFVAHADSAYYEISQLRNAALTERYAGSLEAWGLVGLSPVVRLEPRLSLGGAYYGTLASDATSAEDRQTNQDSIMGRGTGLLGVRVSPSARITAGLWAGGGVQYEDYYRVIQTSSGEQGSAFNVGISAKYEARVRVQWTMIPSVLSVRARVDYQRSTVRRDDQAVTFSLGQVTRASQGVVELDQTELFSRAFVDFEVARFFGFLPSVHAGINTFLLSSDSGSTQASVPVFGAGIRREAF